MLQVAKAAVNGSQMVERGAAPEIAAVTYETYDSMPNISIDYALMEKTANVVTIRGDFGWSDVGSWAALRASGAEIPEGIQPEE